MARLTIFERNPDQSDSLCKTASCPSRSSGQKPKSKQNQACKTKSVQFNKMSNLVFVRLRPLKSGEKQACLGNIAPGASKLICKISIDAKPEEFEFDQVLRSSCSQQDVFDVSKFYRSFHCILNAKPGPKFALTFPSKLVSHFLSLTFIQLCAGRQAHRSGCP
jgi:hypothetical protein